MKVFGVISTIALVLLLGVAVPAIAQEEHQEEGAKPAQHEEPAKPAAKQEQAKPQKPEEQPKAAKQESAKPQKPEEQPKTAKQDEAKPARQEAQPKPVKQEEAKPQQQEHQQQAKTQQAEEKNQHQQEAKAQPQQSHGEYARNGQKDSYGHVYNESHFGPNHHARFEANGGRMYNGRREYSYGGYWFYAGSYPAWFYQQDVYFIMGADGLWYAVAYGSPSLTFQVNIG
jgi:outer membrane biosynthesis protein TonB